MLPCTFLFGTPLRYLLSLRFSMERATQIKSHLQREIPICTYTNLHRMYKERFIQMCNYNHIICKYACTYLEPVSPLFWGLNGPKKDPKRRPFPFKTGVIWVPGICFITQPLPSQILPSSDRKTRSPTSAGMHVPGLNRGIPRIDLRCFLKLSE